MIRPSKTRSEPIVLTSKLGVEYHMSYVGHFHRGGKAYANVVNASLKGAPVQSNDPLGQMDWYTVDTHSRYAQYLEKEPR